jgi:small subunit ribosomal protein S4
MARNTKAKLKKSRRVGMDLGHKTNVQKVARRLNIPPGQHGRRGRSRISEYGLQLQEKQKVKWMYGVLERQLRRYFEQAAKKPTATGQELLKLLETRLDNVVYRLNFAPTRPAARQLVSHGHVRINNKKVDIPSYLVKPSQIITLSSKATNIPVIKELLQQKNKNLPQWLERKAAVGKVKIYPERKDIDADIDEQLIVEFYSR